jgi:hypothetical protein
MGSCCIIPFRHDDSTSLAVATKHGKRPKRNPEQTPACEYCASIDFSDLGFQAGAPEEPAEGTYKGKHRDMQEVLDNSTSRLLCAKQKASLFNCLESEECILEPDIQKWTISVDLSDHPAVEGFKEDGVDVYPALGAKLNRLSVWVEGPGSKIRLNVKFQKCSRDDTYFASWLRNDRRTEPISHPEPYVGRLRPLEVDGRLLRRWKDMCCNGHEKCHSLVPGEFSLPKIWLIDVNKRCVIQLPTSEYQWIALSYVWGNTKVFRLRKISLW